MLFSLTNLPYWIFLGAGLVLFLFVIVSGGGDDDIDVDADVDVDVDVDADIDVDADVDASGNTPVDLDGDFSPLQVLTWFGIGRTPLILLLAIDLTLWGFIGWILNATVGELIERSPVGLLAIGIFVGSLAFALFIGSLLSRPLGRVFAAFGEDASGDRSRPRAEPAPLATAAKPNRHHACCPEVHAGGSPRGHLQAAYYREGGPIPGGHGEPG